MLEPVSPRTYERIESLTRSIHLAGATVSYCPCRILPETVLSLKTVMGDVGRLWRETLGPERHAEICQSSEGARFFAGEVRIVSIQAGRPDMVAVWLPLPPDYPRRLKVQLVDSVEPFEQP